MMKFFVGLMLFLCVNAGQTRPGGQTAPGGEEGGEQPTRPTGAPRPTGSPESGGCGDRDSLKYCAKADAAANTKPVICADGATPTCSETTVGDRAFSCPSCLPKSALEDALDTSCKTLREIPDCAAGAEPTIDKTDSGVCPSCKPALVKDECTRDKLEQCKATLETLAECTERGDFDKTDCCYSCKPPSLACKDRSCSTQARDLPACGEAETAELGGTCCRSCIPKAVHDKKAASDTREWTRDEFNEALRETPECGLGEKPEKDSRLPAATCKRPQSKHSVRDVVECMADRSECESFEEFTEVLPGQTCASCKPPRPTCSPACEENEICVPFARGGRVNMTRGTKCVGKRKFKLRLKARRRMATLRDKMKTMTKEEFVELLREVVARFCERTDDKVKRICDKRLEGILASLKCAVVKRKGQGDNSEVEVEVEVSGDETGEVSETGRRLLSEDDTENFIKDAVNDSEEVEEASDMDGSPSTKLVAGVSIAFVSLVGWMLA